MSTWLHGGAVLSAALQRLPSTSQPPQLPLARVADSMGRTAIFTDLLFKIAARGERLCILVARLLDAFVTVFNLLKTNHGILLNFRELIDGRVKMKTALCPAGAHTYQSMCLGYNSDQHRPGNFRLPKPKKRKFSMLPSCRASAWMTGIESTGGFSLMEVFLPQR